jgi:hypothetical protein
VTQRVTLNAVMKAEETGEGGLYRDGSLTERQQDFVKRLVSGVPQGKAAAMAGYTHPDQEASRLVRLPHIQAAIQRETSRVLLTDGVQNSLRFMVNAPMNEKLPGAVRFQSAKWVLENAGQGLAAQRAALGLPAEDKPLSEMSTSELDGLIDAMRNRLQQTRAQVIEGEARNAHSDGVAVQTQVIEHKGE